MWKGGDILLEHVGENPVEKRIEGKNKEREEGGGERNSTFSLDLATIGSSSFIRARGKVRPHDKGFA